MDNRIEEIKARCEAATPGPWIDDGMGEYIHQGTEKKIGMMITQIRGWGHLTGALKLSEQEAEEIQQANAEFIAHSREDIPYLLSEVERLTSELEAYKTRAEAESALKKMEDKQNEL